MNKKYIKIFEHYDKCFQKYGDNHKGVDWPNKHDLNERYKVMLNIIDFLPIQLKSDKYLKLLDFGAGCGGLYEYIKLNKKNINYTALDISPTFCNLLKQKFPEISVINKDILIKNDILNYDIFILNGVFTEKRELTNDEMWLFVTSILKELWKKCNKGISFIIMSPIVEFKNDDLYYLSYDKLARFLKKNLSKNFIINQSYNLWEYTVYVFKY